MSSFNTGNTQAPNLSAAGETQRQVLNSDYYKDLVRSPEYNTKYKAQLDKMLNVAKNLDSIRSANLTVTTLQAQAQSIVSNNGGKNPSELKPADKAAYDKLTASIAAAKKEVARIDKFISQGNNTAEFSSLQNSLTKAASDERKRKQDEINKKSEEDKRRAQQQDAAADAAQSNSGVAIDVRAPFDSTLVKTNFTNSISKPLGLPPITKDRVFDDAGNEMCSGYPLPLPDQNKTNTPESTVVDKTLSGVGTDPKPLQQLAKKIKATTPQQKKPSPIPAPAKTAPPKPAPRPTPTRGAAAPKPGPGVINRTNPGR